MVAEVLWYTWYQVYEHECVVLLCICCMVKLLQGCTPLHLPVPRIDYQQYELI